MLSLLNRVVLWFSQIWQRLTFDQRRALVSLAVLLIALPTGIYLTDKTQIFNPRGQEVAFQDPINDLNNQLVQANDEYNRAGIASIDRENKLNNMMSLASQRKEELLEELKTNPQVFLQHARLYDQRSNFPEAVQSYIEQQVETEGVLTVIHFDGLDEKESRTAYIVGKYNLYFAQNPPQLLTGSQVRIKAVGLDSALVMEAANGPGRFILQTVTAAPTSATGEQRTAVLMVNFANQVSQPFTKEQLRQVIFEAEDSMNGYYKQTSFGQVSFSGDIFGWYTISLDNTDCVNRSRDWSDEADIIAQRSGVDLVKYTRWVYVFAPAQEDCPYGGVGTIGGNPSRAWIFFGGGRSFIYKHEVGHNLGVHHASSLLCGTKAIDDYSLCGKSEYGDPYDVMGYSREHQFNAPHKIAVGWIPDSKVRTVAQNGNYTINIPLEASGSGTQVVKIPKPDTDEYYFLEYRQPVGFDKSLPSSMTNGVSIHVWDGIYFNQTKLLNLTPNILGNLDNAALSDNATFSDTLNNITVKQLSHNVSSVALDIKTVPFPTNSLLGDWKETTSLPSLPPDLRVVVWGERLFAIGNFRNVYGPPQDIYSAEINSDGTLGSWSKIASLPQFLNYLSAVVWKDYLFVLGTDYWTNNTTLVYSAKINSDGTIGDWSPGVSLPQVLSSIQITIYNNYLFVASGSWSQSGKTWWFISNLYSAQIEKDGSLGSWHSVSIPLTSPVTFNGASIVADSGYLFVIGGFRDDVILRNVHSAKINSDGTIGNWSPTSLLPRSLRHYSVVVHNNHLFVTGGSSTIYNTPRSGVYSAEINSNGTISSWSGSTPLPIAVSGHTAVASRGSLWVLGGWDNNGAVSSVYSAPFQQFLGATISGPSSMRLGQTVSYEAKAQGQDLAWARIYWAKADSDLTKAESWTSIGGSDCVEGSTTCSATGEFTPPGQGSYWLASVANDRKLGPCSGNPEWASVPGWKDCGPTSRLSVQVSSRACIQVITPARNDQTGECREFPTPCDVPQGWTKVASCEATPSPTPTSSSPTGTISGPASGRVGQSLFYTAKGNGPDPKTVSMHWAKATSNLTKGESWNFIAKNQLDCSAYAAVGTDCGADGTFTPTEAGTYYVSVVVVDNKDGPCSGNPKWDSVPGWKDCGQNDAILLTVSP